MATKFVVLSGCRYEATDGYDDLIDGVYYTRAEAQAAAHQLLNPCADGRYRQWFQIIEVRDDNTYAVEYGLIGPEYDPGRYSE